jgi:hypothetical protein
MPSYKPKQPYFVQQALMGIVMAAIVGAILFIAWLLGYDIK